MCYHYSLVATPDELAARYRRRNAEIENYRKTYHISAFTHAECPVVTTDSEIRMFRWGLVPFWTKNVEEALTIRNRTINARSESVFSKPAFREAVKRKRCLVPATGFFDWRHEDGKKIPYLIYLKQEGIFSFAGIYDTWHNPVTDEQLHTFSILTTDANPMMRYIHNTNFRMPVILHENESSCGVNSFIIPVGYYKTRKAYLSSIPFAYILRSCLLLHTPHGRSRTTVRTNGCGYVIGIELQLVGRIVSAHRRPIISRGACIEQST